MLDDLPPFMTVEQAAAVLQLDAAVPEVISQPVAPTPTPTLPGILGLPGLR